MTGKILLATLLTAGLCMLWSCSSDEDTLTIPAPPGGETISLTYSNPVKIEVNPQNHWALLLHDRQSARGAAIQLVDLDRHAVVSTRILDYYDVFDIVFLPNNRACFAGKTQDNRDHAVQFLRLPDLTLDTRIITADTFGTHGYLAVDTAGSFVYYTHAGGEGRDGIYKISYSGTTPAIVDADNDHQAPFGLDNNMVSGLFATPAKVFYDASAQQLIIANLSGDYLTIIDNSLWGTLPRAAGLTFPIPHTAHTTTSGGGLSNVHAEAMAAGAGFYVFAGSSNNQSFLSRYAAGSSIPYPPEVITGVQWQFRNAVLSVHPVEPVFSVFVPQRDSAGVCVGQYSLNNLHAAGAAYRTKSIPDSSIAAIGLDTRSNKIIVGDTRTPRLELIPIR